MTFGRKLRQWIESRRRGGTVPRWVSGNFAPPREGAVTSPASADRPGEDSGSGKDTVDSHFMYYAMNEHTSDDVFEPAEDAEKITFIRLKLPGDAKESATGPDKSPSRPLRRASTPDHA